MASEDNLPTLLQDFYNQFREVVRSIHLVMEENEKGVFINEDIAHSLLNYIALQTQHTTMGSELYTKKIPSKDVGRADLKVTKGDMGMIIEVKCAPTNTSSNKNMEKALQQAKSYQSLLDTNNKIFLAINVEKKSSKTGEGNIELLCASKLSAQERTIAIDIAGNLVDSNKRRRIG